MPVIRYRVYGRVQGVGFRYFVYRHATALGLHGYVRNLDDGGVEMVASGTEEMQLQIEQALRQGPSCALIERLEISVNEQEWDLPDFTIEV